QCSGIIVSGRFVITAAHCLYNNDVIDTISSFNSVFKLNESDLVLHPNYTDSGDSSSGEDVAIIKLNHQANYSKLNFMFNLNNDPFNYSEDVQIKGFGGTNGSLNQANLKMTDWRYCSECSTRGEYSLNAEMIDSSHTTGGDSGAAWLNSNDEIISTHKGSSLVEYPSGLTQRETYSTNLHYAKDFILENIDSWNYPTNVITNGKTTITVQSLHKNNVIDSAYTSGELTLITEESSCLSKTISPFEKCTYVVEGNSGELFISDSEVINIKNQDATGDGSSDG
ncbi:trypsin-like serine protease, partial [Vibrio parahaemolyticus]|uniref:trypsin-like serine protease n=1 Tax=Vibrio parahaemolyticus TaxID=670 RepID=UPI000A1E9091